MKLQYFQGLWTNCNCLISGIFGVCWNQFLYISSRWLENSVIEIGKAASISLMLSYLNWNLDDIRKRKRKSVHINLISRIWFGVNPFKYKVCGPWIPGCNTCTAMNVPISFRIKVFSGSNLVVLTTAVFTTVDHETDESIQLKAWSSSISCLQCCCLHWLPNYSSWT